MNPTLLTIGLFCIRLYTILEMKLRIWCMYLTTNSSMVRSIRYHVQYIFYRVRLFISAYKVEPPYAYWSLSHYDTKLNELILPLVQADNTTEFSYMMSLVSKTSGCNMDCLYYAANDTIVLSRIHSDTALTTTRIRNPFVTVEYTHPEMNEPLVIDLDNRWFVVGNEILSKVFVARYLAYQSKPYVFDDRYILHIMDTKIQMKTVKSSEFVLIDDKSYSIAGNLRFPAPLPFRKPTVSRTLPF